MSERTKGPGVSATPIPEKVTYKYPPSFEEESARRGYRQNLEDAKVGTAQKYTNDMIGGVSPAEKDPDQMEPPKPSAKALLEHLALGQHEKAQLEAQRLFLDPKYTRKNLITELNGMKHPLATALATHLKNQKTQENKGTLNILRDLASKVVDLRSPEERIKSVQDALESFKPMVKSYRDDIENRNFERRKARVGITQEEENQREWMMQTQESEYMAYQNNLQEAKANDPKMRFNALLQKFAEDDEGGEEENK